MNTLKYILFAILWIGITACEDQLDKNPSVDQPDDRMFETVDNGFVALNGIYRAMYSVNWASDYASENFGQSSVNLAADIMAEDMVLYAPGQGWFLYDYLYWVKFVYTGTEDRPYVWWRMYYSLIANCNYIIKYAPEAEGSEEERNSLMGQALALRAYCYFYLAQFYQRTYIGHENDLGVPIYTEPTTKETEGAPRGTLIQTYKRITDDLDDAIALLENASPQTHISHIDYYVANGIRARVALVMEDWEMAETAASKALSKSSLQLMSTMDLVAGFNNQNNSEWMWGAEVIPSHSTTWYSFFSHMDASAGYHASTAQKCVSSWIYDRIDDNDVRKSWFNGPNDNPEQPWEVSYCQQKFRDNTSTLEGDLLYMRAAEMYLILAEARCQRQNYSGAKAALLDVIGYKYPDYEDVLETRTDSEELTLKSTESTAVRTLMDEIILQRRIELWGEGFRILDIKRLKTGFIRNYEGTNHYIQEGLFDITNPESWEWVMMIPQKEFDGNASLDPQRDQNPASDEYLEN